MFLENQILNPYVLAGSGRDIDTNMLCSMMWATFILAKFRIVVANCNSRLLVGNKSDSLGVGFINVMVSTAYWPSSHAAKSLSRLAGLAWANHRQRFICFAEVGEAPS